MTAANPLLIGAGYLKRGDTFDIEHWHMTHRLRVAHGILRGLGIESVVKHSDNEIVEWGRPKHGCDYRCETVWPEWVTNDLFNLAFKLADEYQTRHGAHNQRQAREARARMVAQ